MIPVACVGVHYNFGPCPQIFTRALAQFHGWAAWFTWHGFPSAGLGLRHPRALRLSPSLPAPYEHRGLPFLALPPSDAHVAFWRFGPLSEGRLWPLHYPGRLDPWHTVRCPGCPLINTLLSTATLPAGPWTPAPYKTGFEPSFHTNNKTTSFW